MRRNIFLFGIAISAIPSNFDQQCRMRHNIIVLNDLSIPNHGFHNNYKSRLRNHQHLLCLPISARSRHNNKRSHLRYNLFVLIVTISAYERHGDVK